LINVADTPELCDFYLGSIVQKGHLKIAISTNGKSPTIAKRIKQVLQEAIPDSLNEVLDKLQIIRDRLKGDFSEKVKQLNQITEVLVKKD
jgi:siroheme synthase-like protein